MIVFYPIGFEHYKPALQLQRENCFLIFLSFVNQLMHLPEPVFYRVVSKSCSISYPWLNGLEDEISGQDVSLDIHYTVPGPT